MDLSGKTKCNFGPPRHDVMGRDRVFPNYIGPRHGYGDQLRWNSQGGSRNLDLSGSSFKPMSGPFKGQSNFDGGAKP